MDNIADSLKEMLAEINVAKRGMQLDEPRRETYAHLCRAKDLTEQLLASFDRMEGGEFRMAAE